MNTIREKAIEILDIATNIYLIQESNNPNVIFGDKTFLIGTESNPEAVIVKRNYEEKDRFYYFKTPEIEGAIIKRENGNFCIKARVRYSSINNQNLYFAKIRIESSNDGDIKIMGKWGGSWKHSDYDDEDLLKNPSLDFLAALDSMRNSIDNIHSQLSENHELNQDLYDPEWVRKLKRCNN